VPDDCGTTASGVEDRLGLAPNHASVEKTAAGFATDGLDFQDARVAHRREGRILRN
jgi:hypothetical protein